MHFYTKHFMPTPCPHIHKNKVTLTILYYSRIIDIAMFLNFSLIIKGR